MTIGANGRATIADTSVSVPLGMDLTFDYATVRSGTTSLPLAVRIDRSKPAASGART